MTPRDRKNKVVLSKKLLGNLKMQDYDKFIKLMLDNFDYLKFLEKQTESK